MNLLRVRTIYNRRICITLLSFATVVTSLTLAMPSAEASPVSSVKWTLVGPAPIVDGQASRAAADTSGRVDCVTVSGQTVYLGAANGGIWKSQNQGQSWSPISDAASSLAIGCITVDSKNPSIIFAGTGELHYSGDSYFGRGILKSTDGGNTWVMLGQSQFGGGYISQILVNSIDDNELLVSSDKGVFKSTDGGITFTHVLDRQHTSYSMVMPPGKPNVVFASMGTLGIFKSEDFGDTWKQLAGGLPSSNVGVSSIAVDPANEGTLYSSISMDESHGYELNGIFKSIDGGMTWTQLPGVPSYFDEGYAYGESVGKKGQGQYDNCIAVDPANPNHIVAGGITFIESMDGGQSWKDLTMPSSPDFSVDMHPDFHTIAFDRTGNMYVGNDGGVWLKSTSGRWSDLNTDLSLTQFYSGMSVDINNQIFGGTQDNGTLRYDGQLGWTHLFGGDGGYTAIDPRDSNVLYAEALGQGDASGADIVRSTDGGNTWNTISPQYQDSNSLPWLTPVILSPENPDTLFVGADRLYKSVDDGQSYTPISSEFAVLYNGKLIHDPVSVVSQSPTDPNVIYVGTVCGQVDATFNGGQSWKSVTPIGADSNLSVSSILIDSSDSNQITVSFGGFNYPESNRHVFYTSDVSTANPSWRDLTGNLPDSPVNAAIEANGMLYVGTDSGVFEAMKGTTNWAKVGLGLPNSPVMNLLISHNGYLIAGTHGRGVFECLLPTAASDTSSVNIQQTTAETSLLTKYAHVYPEYFTQVMLNTKFISRPIALTYQNTTYMPIYYIGNVLSAEGFQTAWDGINQNWKITKSNLENTDIYLNAKTGTVNIYVNGKLKAAHVTRVVQIDPYSGHNTTYLPIWFVQQILRSVGISNTWSASTANKTWALTDNG